MSQINPYRNVVVPSLRTQPAPAKKDGQGKRRQPPRQEKPKTPGTAGDGKGLDVTA